MGHSKWKLGSALMLGMAVFLAEPAMSVAQDNATTETARRGRGERGARGGERGPRGGGAGFGGVHRVALELKDITPEQKEKIEKLQEEMRGKMQELRSKASQSGEGRGRGSWNTPEFQKLMQDARSQVEAVLTDEQKKELEQKLSEQRSRWSSRRTTGTAERQ